MTSPVSTAAEQTARNATEVSIDRTEMMEDQVRVHPAQPLVSVIIPTLHRPTLLMRALASVFRQTWRELEVVVVVDGPDPDTIAVLQTIDDPRLRVIVNARSLTAAGAATPEWITPRGEWTRFSTITTSGRPRN